MNDRVVEAKAPGGIPWRDIIACDTTGCINKACYEVGMHRFCGDCRDFVKGCGKG